MGIDLKFKEGQRYKFDWNQTNKQKLIQTKHYFYLNSLFHYQ